MILLATVLAAESETVSLSSLLPLQILYIGSVDHGDHIHGEGGGDAAVCHGPGGAGSPAVKEEAPEHVPPAAGAIEGRIWRRLC